MLIQSGARQDDIEIDAQFSSLEERWHAVLHGVAEAVRVSGRAAGDVRLVAVSKYHPAAAVARLALLGQRDFGENYIQEARAKQILVADMVQQGCAKPQSIAIQWHCIGAVQTNKAKEAAGHFALIHTVASVKLAQKMADTLATHHNGEVVPNSSRVQDVLIQVNIGEEPQKSGVLPADLPALAEGLLALPPHSGGIRVLGLMCLPPRCGEGDLARPYFSRLRKLRDDLELRTGHALPHLSMGMSGDYPQAIAEGATLVRVGTDIFGDRPAASS